MNMNIEHEHDYEHDYERDTRERIEATENHDMVKLRQTQQISTKA